MTQQQTITTIRQHAKRIFAQRGYDGLSMRTLAQESGVGLSSIYHFFADKDVLLKDCFTRISTDLGAERLKLKQQKTAEQMLRDRIDFQFKYIEDVVFVLKYYLHYRDDFLKTDTTILPAKAYLHIEEVLHKGIANGEFSLPNKEIDAQAKIITHSVNGFLLEYYPQVPKGNEYKELVVGIANFVMRSLTNPQPQTGR
jgi:AcrR family transcriptional regulator